MINKYEERLGTERMLPLVFKMALPAVAAQFVNLLYSMVDRIYIGHIPGIGTDALAGVGVTTSLVILISSFSAIVGGGGAPLAAIALGQGDRSRAGKILGNGFILLILFTLFTSLIAYTFMEPILLFTGASENTLEYAVNYLSIYLLGTIFVEISTGLNSFINAQGRPAIAMYSVLIGALLNIVLDPIFIFWLDMGVKGAALATVLSQACSAVWVLTFLFSRHASLPLEKTLYGVEPGNNTFYICFGRITVYYGKYRKPGRLCSEQQPERFWRYLCQRIDHLAKCDAICKCPINRICARVRSYCEL